MSWSSPETTCRARGAAALASFLLLGALLWAPEAEALRLGPPPPPSPQRVVTLAPSLTELVLDLGLGDRLVGVSRFDDAPEVQKLPRVGGLVDPSAEAILRLSPDLLLVPPGAGDRATVERLAKLGVPVLVVPLQSLGEVLEGIEAVAAALGEAERGKLLRRSIEEKLETLRKRAEKRPRVRTLIVFGWEPLVVGGAGSYADELLRLAGGENAAGDLQQPFPVLPAERALGLRAERIVDATFGYVPRVVLPGWEAKLVEAKSQALARPGSRLVEALEELLRLLHTPETSP